MKKAVVIYKSKSGYTKTYAEWISEALQCDLKYAEHLTIEQIQDYDIIIYGGGLYAVGINGISLIKNNLNKLEDKNIVVWATGCSPGHKEQLKEVWDYNFTQEQQKTLKMYYLRGGFDYTKLRPGDKLLMKMLKMKLNHMKEQTEDSMGMLKAYDVPEYHCSKDKIADLVEYVKTLL